MKRAFSIFSTAGAVMILLGLVWIGQGSGYFPYPASSFMINDTSWIYWGLLLAALGVAAILVARRRVQ